MERISFEPMSGRGSLCNGAGAAGFPIVYGGGTPCASRAPDLVLVERAWILNLSGLGGIKELRINQRNLSFNRNPFALISANQYFRRAHGEPIEFLNGESTWAKQ